MLSDVMAVLWMGQSIAKRMSFQCWCPIEIETGVSSADYKGETPLQYKNDTSHIYITFSHFIQDILEHEAQQETVI